MSPRTSFLPSQPFVFPVYLSPQSQLLRLLRVVILQSSAGSSPASGSSSSSPSSTSLPLCSPSSRYLLAHSNKQLEHRLFLQQIQQQLDVFSPASSPCFTLPATPLPNGTPSSATSCGVHFFERREKRQPLYPSQHQQGENVSQTRKGRRKKEGREMFLLILPSLFFCSSPFSYC